MKHKRNTSGLASTASKKKQDAITKTEAAIQALLREGAVINFKTVSEKAEVSKAWLYKEIAIADRIKRIRDQQVDSLPKSRNESEKASDASKTALIATLKAKIKELEKEKGDLKKQLEIVYGKLHDSTL